MSEDTTKGPVEVELLLAEQRWLTGVVRDLVAADDVDDVVQGTWLAALRRPPAQAGTLRGWLHRVARNLALDLHRGRRRREQRERAAAPHEALPSTAEVVERLGTYERVARAVRDLAEPYRSTLLLRHYHGLSVGEVAQRLGISDAAVRQRVKRGLDQVRARLAQRYGDGWRLALGALLPGGSRVLAPVAISAGALVMGKHTVITAAALAAGTLTWMFWPGEPPVSAHLDPAAAQARPAPTQVGNAAPARTTRDAAGGRRALPAPDQPVAPGDAAGLAGVVVDVRARPVPGVRLHRADATGPGEALATTGADGRFTIAAALQREPAVEPRFALVRSVPVGRVREAGGLRYIVAPAARVAGEVRGPDGAPLGDVHVEVQLAPLIDYPRSLDEMLPPGDRIERVGDDGRFELTRLPGGAARLRFSKPGYRSGAIEVVETGAAGVVVVLQPRAEKACVLAGRVLDHAGSGVPGALVGLGEDTARADAYGAFELGFVAADLRVRPQNLWASKPGLQTLAGTPLGGPSLAVEPGAVIRRDLQLGRPCLSIHGVVLDDAGEPLAGARVTLWREEQVVSYLFAHDLALGREPPSRGAPIRLPPDVRTDASGRFELAGLSDREYHLRVLHDTLLGVTSGPVRGGTTGFTVRYPPDRLRPVDGRLVDVAGNPIGGLQVRMSVCELSMTGGGRWMNGQLVTADAEGRFRLDRVPRDEQVLLAAYGTTVVPGFCALGTGMDDHYPQVERLGPDEIRMVVERRCHFRVECTDPRHAGSRFVLRDAADQPVMITVRAAGGGSTNNGAHRLVQGKTAVLSTSERAVTLVLTEDGEEVRRVPLRLRPGEPVVVRM